MLRVAGLVRHLWMSTPGLRVQMVSKAVRRRLRFAASRTEPGHCPLCARQVRFVAHSDNPREGLVCLRCGSVPRHRALAMVVESMPHLLVGGRVHESSPSLCTLDFLRQRARACTASYFFPDVAAGGRVGAFVAVDLCRQPFGDAAFDLVVTEDVLEHIDDPVLALQEIQRTLKPGGCHVFTVPRVLHAATRARVRFEGGRPQFLAPPEHHRNPISRAGSLVVTDWGADLEAIVAGATGGRCESRRIGDAGRGIPVEVEVFVSTR